MLKLHFDGSCAPKNPGGIAISSCSITRDGQEIYADCVEVCRGDGATVNVAEWFAVLMGLRWLQEQDWDQLEIIGDSQLVIHQLNGIYQCRKPHLQKYYNECKDLLKNKQWTAKWVPRELNSYCDEMGRIKYKELIK